MTLCPILPQPHLLVVAPEGADPAGTVLAMGPHCDPLRGIQVGQRIRYLLGWVVDVGDRRYAIVHEDAVLAVYAVPAGVPGRMPP